MEKRRRLSLKTRHGVEDSNKRRNVECQCSVSQEQLYTNENNMDTMLFKASKDSGIQGDTMTPKREECKLVDCCNSVSTLYNHGNTCYMNSIIFVMRYLKEFRNCLHHLGNRIEEINRNSYCEFKHDAYKEVILQLHELFKTMHTAEFTRDGLSETNDEYPDSTGYKVEPSSPAKFLESIRDVDTTFEGNQQHDVHEFLGFLLHCMEKTLSNYQQWHSMILACKTTRRSGRIQAIAEKLLKSPINIFEGRRLLKIQCLECENYSEIMDTFRDVAITCDFALLNHESFMKALQDRDVLCNEDKFWCTFCQHYNEATRSSYILELPEVLVIQVRPPSTSNVLLKDVAKSKDRAFLPERLECFLDSCPRPCLQPSHHFELTAVICHIGPSLTAGHYVVYINSKPVSALSDAFSKRENCCSPKAISPKSKWVMFNDDRAHFTDIMDPSGNRSSETPYLLVYQRSEERQDSQEIYSTRVS